MNTDFDFLGDFALFSPPLPFSPAIYVVFEPINRLARHLVEFQIQLGSEDGARHFHIDGPTGLSENVSITETQLISGVVDVVPGSMGNYLVTLRQIGFDNLQDSAWAFRWVRVSSIA